MVNPYNELPTTVPIPQAPSQDIQASIDYLASLPKMNIPQIPDIEEIKRKMAEANMNFPEPVSYPDQLQAIRNLPQPNLQNNFMGRLSQKCYESNSTTTNAICWQTKHANVGRF
jgi:hypothetical protein